MKSRSTKKLCQFFGPPSIDLVYISCANQAAIVGHFSRCRLSIAWRPISWFSWCVPISDDTVSSLLSGTIDSRQTDRQPQNYKPSINRPLSSHPLSIIRQNCSNRDSIFLFPTLAMTLKDYSWAVAKRRDVILIMAGAWVDSESNEVTSVNRQQ